MDYRVRNFSRKDASDDVTRPSVGAHNMWRRKCDEAIQKLFL